MQNILLQNKNICKLRACIRRVEKAENPQPNNMF